MSQIKTAVSLYSLQDSYARGRLDLPGVLNFVAGTGAHGVELLSDQMIKNSPYPSDETVAAWREALSASGLTPVCNDVFVNATIYRNRTLRPAEQAVLLRRELDVSKKLGFNLVRLVSNTRADVTLEVLSYAESIGMHMALEIHAAMSFSNRLTREWIEMMHKTQSERLGLVIDFGIFCDRRPRVDTNYFRTIGLNPALADKLDELYAQHGDTYRIFTTDGSGERVYPDEVSSLIRNDVDAEYAFFSTTYESTPLNVLDEHFDYIRHCHAKCYEVLPDGAEYSIDYPAILTRLNHLGYDGYLATEYEGNRFTPLDERVDDQGQVAAHQAMLAAHIDDGK
ncbi:sugar phosphate isomerase/epimerase family protein [Virgisporangium aurantiacum]|uniref:Sugar phosphate isomerase/epimerase n=1 Tax=Virgisporangium aurantiacum TaxID=175570 RepID=A0A8J3ZHU3_9ACTN|nr:TIM barrel protein [Virgisporangium aurantiacum]GIJ62160.1 hypothetical protein Vau01_096760 [Virgisporangium aurantiacum]